MLRARPSVAGRGPPWDPGRSHMCSMSSPRGVAVRRVICDEIQQVLPRPQTSQRNRALSSYTSVEVCAGAGGQALGLEKAGFDHVACVEYDVAACQTLRANRPKWNV